MSLCLHCDEKILTPVFNNFDQNKKEIFCCAGCMTVFNAINNLGLEKYYEIKEQSAIFKRRSPVENKFQNFTYLDDPDFLESYAYENLANKKTMEFYLEGIHCLACLWLIEKMPEYLKDVLISRLDMQKSVATISLNDDGKFSHAARELNNLGYKPHPLKRNQSIQNFKKHEERKMLLKIGIAGAGAANIMLYAFSIYAGADGKFAETFNLLTVLFAIPVLFYSATPFYQNAWNAIKNRTLSIDIPISLALIIGAFSGLYNQAIGINENFYDSLTTLVFLLLLSRYFLNKIQEEGLTANDLNFFYEGNSVLKKVDEQFIETHPSFLKPGDLIKVSTNEMIPVDGIVIEGESLISNSLLTGESRPVNVSVNQDVFSGTINLTNPLLIKTNFVKENSRLGKILKQVEGGWISKSPIVDLTNKISKYFIACIFVLASILFITLYSQGKTKIAIEHSLALLIVTCPCALALATPLTLTRTLKRAGKIGIIIKNNEVIEKLSTIKNIFLDKTGTVTYGALKICHFNILKNSHCPLFEVIIGLEKYSTHPVAVALREFSFENGARIIHPIKNYIELMGVGVSGEINHHLYEIKNGQIFEDGICVADFSLEDNIRPDSRASITELKSLGLNVKMLSGDKLLVAKSIAKQVGIDDQNVYAEMTPENKLSIIDNGPDSLMVGDGANDAMALSRSYVSVAVLGSLDISLKASDIFLATPGISHLGPLIVIAKETMRVIKRNLILSLIYNALSVYAVFTGAISPLIAAIIMPVSSLTILASTIIGTKKLNTSLKYKVS